MTAPTITTITELRRALDALGDGIDAEWLYEHTLACWVDDDFSGFSFSIDQGRYTTDPQPRTLRAAYDAMARMMGDV